MHWKHHNIRASSVIGILAIAGLVACGGEAPEPVASGVMTDTNVMSSAAAVGEQGRSEAEHAAFDAVPRVSVDLARDLVEQGEAVLVDIRSIRQYEAGHIPGAIHVPYDQLDAAARTLPRDRMIITYCT